MEEKKVPALRFRGFDNAWEQCKFSDVVEIGSGMDYKHLGIGDIPVYGTGGYMLSVDVALSENNDAIGIGRKGTIDKPYILRAPFWTVDTLFYCIPKYNHNLDFTNCLFQNIDWKNKDESTGVPSLSKVIINSIETSIPSYEEQKKIGEYFKSFENLIILHQRKLEMLKKVKKSMLEKMFPKNDAKVPEVRFSDFTDAWEQHKLGELSEKTYGGGTPSTANAEYWCGNIPWLQSSDIIDGKLFDVTPKKYISQVGLNSSAAQLIPENSIAIITRVGVGKLAFLSFFYTTSQDFLSMSRLTTEPYFTVYACYKKLQSELNSVQGTSIKGITKDELLAKEIKVPSYDEQKQIGEYFTNLDHLISLHQRKLEKLKNIKKSMLEKMFII